jgi:adenosylmethionine-8-amino-7-oxononanoate aminotransferase
MANALACAAANASLDLFEREPRLSQVEAIEAQLTAELAACKALPQVVDVRVKGAIGVVQLAPEVDVYGLRPAFVARGVWVRPFGDMVYVCPALTISAGELSQLTGAVVEVVSGA